MGSAPGSTARRGEAGSRRHRAWRTCTCSPPFTGTTASRWGRGSQRQAATALGRAAAIRGTWSVPSTSGPSIRSPACGNRNRGWNWPCRLKGIRRVQAAAAATRGALHRPAGTQGLSAAGPELPPAWAQGFASGAALRTTAAAWPGTADPCQQHHSTVFRPKGFHRRPFMVPAAVGGGDRAGLPHPPPPLRFCRATVRSPSPLSIAKPQIGFGVVISRPEHGQATGTASTRHSAPAGAGHWGAITRHG